MLPVPWIGTGTQEATRSANPGRGQGILGGPAAGPSAWGEGRAEMEAGGGPGLPAKPWKKASPFGIGQSQVPPGAWALAEQSHQVPQPSSPGGVGGGGRAQAGSH